MRGREAECTAASDAGLTVQERRRGPESLGQRCGKQRSHRFRKIPQLFRRPQPDLRSVSRRLAPHQNAKPAPLDCAKSRFVGQIVAQICDGLRALAACLVKKHPHRFAFSRPGAQFQASFEFEQRQAVHFRQWLEQCARPLLDGFGFSGRHAAPVHRDRIRLSPLTSPPSGSSSKLRHISASSLARVSGGMTPVRAGRRGATARRHASPRPPAQDQRRAAAESLRPGGR